MRYLIVEAQPNTSNLKAGSDRIKTEEDHLNIENFEVCCDIKCLHIT